MGGRGSMVSDSSHVGDHQLCISSTEFEQAIKKQTTDKPELNIDNMLDDLLAVRN